MKGVMKLIKEYTKSEEVYDNNPGKWTQDCTTKIWEALEDKYVDSKLGGSCTSEISCKILYNKMEMAMALN